jgi:hypothetical protein
MEEKDLKQLAIDVSENKVFGTFHMNESDSRNLSVVFMPLIFLNDEQRKEMVDDNIVHFYEYYDKAGPRSVNGMPCFFSVCRINKDDWNKTVKYIKEYEMRVKSFLDRKEEKEPVSPTLFDGDNDDRI